MTPRQLAQYRQCTHRRGEPAGCPCQYPSECRVPPLELTERIAAEKAVAKAEYEAMRERMRLRKEQREGRVPK